jgi:hypothetical protein
MHRIPRKATIWCKSVANLTSLLNGIRRCMFTTFVLMDAAQGCALKEWDNVTVRSKPIGGKRPMNEAG